MTKPETVSYPGASTEPDDLLLLANQYRLAAQHLLSSGHICSQALRSPGMLCATHAIELYLSTLIRKAGEKPERVRAYRHRLSEMSEHDSVNSLRLRKKTRQHLAAMTENREYLVLRYAPDQEEQLSQLNRLTSTLEEVATKVGKAFDRSRAAKKDKAGSNPALSYSSDRPTG